MTGNKPVIASEVEAAANTEAEATGVKTVIYVNASETIKERKMDLDQLRVKAADDVTGAEQRFLQAHAAELSADERKKFEIAEPVAATEEKKPEEKPKVVTASEVTGAEGVVSIQAADLKAIQDSNAAHAEALKAAQESLTALQASVKSMEENNNKLQENAQASEREKLKAIVEAAATRGAIKADRVESYTNRLVAAQGEDREALIADLQALAGNPLLAAAQGSKQTEGGAAMDVEAEIMKKANELVASAAAKNEKLNIFQARQQVLVSDPDLASRSVRSIQASSTGFDPYNPSMSWSSASLPNVNREVTRK